MNGKEWKSILNKRVLFKKKKVNINKKSLSAHTQAHTNYALLWIFSTIIYLPQNIRYYYFEFIILLNKLYSYVAYTFQ